jgi:hypothetical protein
MDIKGLFFNVKNKIYQYKSFCETNYTDITFLSGSNSKQQIFQFVISDLQSK